MKKQLEATNQTQTKLSQHIADLISTDIETFRNEASDAFAIHIKKERAILESLNGKGIDGQTLLAAWENEVLAVSHKLDKKLDDETLKKCLSKNLFLNKSGTDSKTAQLIHERKIEILDEFILKYYPLAKKSKKDIYKKQRRAAVQLLSISENEILELKNHQANFIEYQTAANEHNIAVIDPCDSKSKRKKVALQIEAEQRQVLTAENDRLYEIKNRLNSLSVASGGVLIDILDKKWDLTEILNLREQYEKAISKLPKKDTNNAIKRLEIFDRETRDFRNEQTTKLVINAEQVSLTTARTITKDIDNILLRVFDLTDAQKDKLVQNAKEYNELTHEQSNIIKIQSNRLKVSK